METGITISKENGIAHKKKLNNNDGNNTEYSNSMICRDLTNMEMEQLLSRQTRTTKMSKQTLFMAQFFLILLSAKQLSPLPTSYNLRITEITYPGDDTYLNSSDGLLMKS
jgi:hypothetical protein